MLLTRHKVVQLLSLLCHHIRGARLAGGLQANHGALAAGQGGARHAHNGGDL